MVKQKFQQNQKKGPATTTGVNDGGSSSTSSTVVNGTTGTGVSSQRNGATVASSSSTTNANRRRDREKSIRTSTSNTSNQTQTNISNSNRDRKVSAKDTTKDVTNSSRDDAITNGRIDKEKSHQSHSHNEKTGQNSTSSTSLSNGVIRRDKDKDRDGAHRGDRTSANASHAVSSSGGAGIKSHQLSHQYKSSQQSQPQSHVKSTVESCIREVPVPPARSFSTSSTQTNKHYVVEDTVLSYLEHSEWDRVELICELIAVLSPLDLRLVGSVIEGLGRNHSLQFKPMEHRANSNIPLHSFPTANPQLSGFLESSPSLGLGTRSSSTSSANSHVTPPATTLATTTNGSPQEKALSDAGTETNATTPSGQSSSSTSGDIPLFELIDALYMLITLLSSTNRKSAYQIALYVESLVIGGRSYHLSTLKKKSEQLKAVTGMGKIVSACIHHPAFSAPERIRFLAARDELKCEAERLAEEVERQNAQSKAQKAALMVSSRGVGAPDEEVLTNGTSNDGARKSNLRSATSPSEAEDEDDYNEDETTVTSSNHMNTNTLSFSPHHTFVYIKQFIGQQLESNDPNTFHIEMRWSDGEVTWTQRTRKELTMLQHRLLDEFGQQRKEMTSSALGAGSFDEEKRNSCSSLEITGRRILPHLMKDAPPRDVINYINDLSDLPARMLLSPAMYEEFHATRMRSTDDADEMILSRMVRSRTPPIKRHTVPITTTPNYSVTMMPMSYGPVPMSQMQVLEASCSTCAGYHPYAFCDKVPIIERKSDFKLDYNPEHSDTDMSNNMNGPMGNMPPGMMAPHYPTVYQQQLAMAAVSAAQQYRHGGMQSAQGGQPQMAFANGQPIGVVYAQPIQAHHQYTNGNR